MENMTLSAHHGYTQVVSVLLAMLGTFLINAKPIDDLKLLQLLDHYWVQANKQLLLFSNKTYYFRMNGEQPSNSTERLVEHQKYNQVMFEQFKQIDSNRFPMRAINSH